MLDVTESARALLKGLLTANSDETEAGLRLTMNDAGEFGLAIDVEQEEDQVIEHEDCKILFIEKNVSDKLDGFTIDIQDTPEGARLSILKKELD